MRLEKRRVCDMVYVVIRLPRPNWRRARDEFLEPVSEGAETGPDGPRIGAARLPSRILQARLRDPLPARDREQPTAS